MNSKNFTFDYHSGTIRRDFLKEAPKAILVKKTPVKNGSKGIVSTVKSLFNAN